jgi:hypothetical protein
MNSSFLRSLNILDASNPASPVRIMRLTTSIIFLLVLVSFNSDALATFNGRGDFHPEEDKCLTQLSLIWAARKSADKAMAPLAAQDRYIRMCLSIVSKDGAVVVSKRLNAAFYAPNATPETKDRVWKAFKILHGYFPPGDDEVANRDDAGGNALN